MGYFTIINLYNYISSLLQRVLNSRRWDQQGEQEVGGLRGKRVPIQ